MKPASIKPVRCAIYTRVSTEQGLDQGGIGRLTCIGIREKADTAREQRSILGGPVSHGGEDGQSQEEGLR